MCSSSPGRTPKLQLSAEQPSTGECWIPPEKDIPHPRPRRSQGEDGRRGEIALCIRIKPHTLQRYREDSNKTLCAPGPRGPPETEPDLPLNDYLLQHGSAVACCGVRCSGCSRPGSHSVTHHRTTKQMTHRL